MSYKLDDHALDLLFRTARTYNHWRDIPVPDETLHSIARLLFVKSPQAKARLRPALMEGNVEKTMTAPVTAIIGYDPMFYEHLPRTFPQADARSWFAGNAALIQETAFRNGTLQGAYLIMAARAFFLRRHSPFQFSVQSGVWRSQRPAYTQSAAILYGTVPGSVTVPHFNLREGPRPLAYSLPIGKTLFRDTSLRGEDGRFGAKALIRNGSRIWTTIPHFGSTAITAQRDAQGPSAFAYPAKGYVPPFFVRSLPFPDAGPRWR
ncbi:MAG: 3-hydroxypropanoate dehydrogenase [Rhodospirillaceae bacterium]|nr:MAG: 3-hydroxypropanoate dehydrogenase [Rhodospirillaceae bacterium]